MRLPWRTAAKEANNVLIRYNKIIESTKAVIGKKCCQSLKPEFDLRINTKICNSLTMKKFYIEALIDCRATDSFIDQDLVNEQQIPIKPLFKPFPIYQSNRERTSVGDVTRYSSSKNCPNVWPFCNVWVIT